jgi:23S rRNA (uracil1939-C5)-methyltransferase
MRMAEILIEELGHRALGIGRIGGKVVMVPFSAPGDVVEVKFTRRHSSFDQARVVRVIRASEIRVEPECPYFGRCGGCQLQHISHEHQCRIKFELFRRELARAIPREQLNVRPMVVRGGALSYRTKLELHILWEPRPIMGFMGWGTRDLVAIDSCRLAREPLNAALSLIREVLKGCDAKEISRMEVACDADDVGWTAAMWAKDGLGNRTVRCLSSEASGLPGLRCLAVAHRRGAELRVIWRSPAGPRGVLYPVGSLGLLQGMRLEAWPGVFRQINPEVNSAMLEYILHWASCGEGGRALDLYAGMGNITFALSRAAKEVLAVEVNQIAVENAMANAMALNVHNITWKRASAKKALRELVREGEGFELVVADPPRGGIKELIPLINELPMRRLIYVSCDPATLCRDLALLTSGGNFRVVESTPFEMFPQTYHLESVTVIDRTA